MVPVVSCLPVQYSQCVLFTACCELLGQGEQGGNPVGEIKPSPHRAEIINLLSAATHVKMSTLYNQIFHTATRKIIPSDYVNHYCFFLIQLFC